MSETIIIIGNGVSGATAAREIRKRMPSVPILMLSGESEYHYSRTALMYIFMGHMDFVDTQPYAEDFWSKNRIELKQAWVTAIDGDAKSIELEGGECLSYKELIIATGSVPNRFGWPGQDLPGVQGLYSKQDLELLEESAKEAKHAVLVGGGLIGVEMAEMLISRGIGVTFLVREGNFWGSVLPLEESQMVGEHILEHHIDLQFNEELGEIIAGEDGKVAKIVTKSGKEIECQIVGLTAGVKPNIDWLRGLEGLDLGRGVLVDHYFRTSLPNVWSIGDCAEFREPLDGRRPIEQVWYTGKMQATFLAESLSGHDREYAPGIWWNSAKFFDLEYQTYGVVMPKPSEGESVFFWEDKKKKLSFRVHFDSESLAVTGVNVFGLRHRHQVWEHWIHEKTPVPQVIASLPEANFDPEFFRRVEPEVVEAWNTQHPEMTVEVAPKVKKGLFSKLLRTLNHKN